MSNEAIKTQLPMHALHTFAGTLTSRVRELNEMERNYTIYPGQATDILVQLIEAHLYSMFKTMIASEKATPEDKEAAFKALLLLTSDNTNPLSAHDILEPEQSDV